jgi:hypothetical protein
MFTSESMKTVIAQLLASATVLIGVASPMAIATGCNASPSGPEVDEDIAASTSEVITANAPETDTPTADTPAVELEVTPDPDNVVADRLEGVWQINDAVSERLGSLSGGPGLIEFRSDSAAITEIPPEYGEIFSDSTIYLAGTVTLAVTETITEEGETTPAYPFLLTEMHGTPALLIFAPLSGLPFGRYSVWFVMLAAAENPSNDLLFLNLDYNNRPTMALDRVSATQP